MTTTNTPHDFTRFCMQVPEFAVRLSPGWRWRLTFASGLSTFATVMLLSGSECATQKTCQLESVPRRLISSCIFTLCTLCWVPGNTVCKNFGLLIGLLFIFCNFVIVELESGTSSISVLFVLMGLCIYSLVNDVNWEDLCEDEPESRRKYAFDHCRFVLSICVVIGHVSIYAKGWTEYQYLYRFIHGFEMQGFAFISGYFSKSFAKMDVTEDGKATFSISSQKLKALVTAILLPYFSARLFRFAGMIQLDIVTSKVEFPSKFQEQIEFFLDAFRENKHVWDGLGDSGWYMLALFMWRLSIPLWQVTRWPIIFSWLVAFAAPYFALGGSSTLERSFQYLPFFVVGLRWPPKLDEILKNQVVQTIACVYIYILWVLDNRGPLPCNSWQAHLPTSPEKHYPMIARYTYHAWSMLNVVAVLAIFHSFLDFRSILSSHGTRTINNYILHPWIGRVLIVAYGFCLYASTKRTDDNLEPVYFSEGKTQFALVSFCVVLSWALSSSLIATLSKPLMNPSCGLVFPSKLSREQTSSVLPSFLCSRYDRLPTSSGRE